MRTVLRTVQARAEDCLRREHRDRIANRGSANTVGKLGAGRCGSAQSSLDLESATPSRNGRRCNSSFSSGGSHGEPPTRDVFSRRHSSAGTPLHGHPADQGQSESLIRCTHTASCCWGRAKPIVLVAVDWCEIRNEALRAMAAGPGPRGGHRTCTGHGLLRCTSTTRPFSDLGAEKSAGAGRIVRRNVRLRLSRTNRAARRRRGAPRVSNRHGPSRISVPDKRGWNRSRPKPARRPARRARDVQPRQQLRPGTKRTAKHPTVRIDPFLKTVSFWNADEPILALHAYATHPMSYYGRGDLSADFVGMARDRIAAGAGPRSGTSTCPAAAAT